MGYYLQAIIAERALLAGLEIVGTRSCGLPQGMALFPLVDEVLAHFRVSRLPLTDEPAVALHHSLASWLEEISQEGRAAYVEAEFFGGEGSQACVCAERGVLESPYLGQDAINRALAFLGVTKGAHLDEFDALGLGKHRSTEGWG